MFHANKRPAAYFTFVHGFVIQERRVSSCIFKEATAARWGTESKFSRVVLLSFWRLQAGNFKPQVRCLRLRLNPPIGHISSHWHLLQPRSQKVRGSDRSFSRSVASFQPETARPITIFFLSFQPPFSCLFKLPRASRGSSLMNLGELTLRLNSRWGKREGCCCKCCCCVFFCYVKQVVKGWSIFSLPLPFPFNKFRIRDDV